MEVEEKASQEQRNPTAKRRGNKRRAEEEGADEDMDEAVTELISQVHMQLTVQLGSRMRVLEPATHCTH